MPPIPSHRGARSILSNWAGFAISSAVSFFLSPLVVRGLGDSGYGAWILIGSLTGYLGLLDLGVRSAVTRYVAKFHAQSSHDQASRMASAAGLIFAISGVIAIVASFGLAFLATRIFNIPPDLVRSVRFVFPIVGLNVCIALLSGVFGGVVTALQRFDLSNAVEIAAALLRATAIVIALKLGQGIVALAVIHTAVSLVTLIAYSLLARKLYPEMEIRIGIAQRDDFRTLLSFSTYAFLLHISSFVVYYMDSVVIGAFLPMGQITYFAIAGNLMVYSRALLSGISTATSPLASALEGQGRMDQVSRMLLNRARFASLLIFPICATFLIRGETFLKLWMGPKFAVPSGKVLYILSLALIFAAGNQIAGSTMIGISRHKLLVPFAIAEGLANLGLSIALVRTMDIYGVAWGTAIPSLLMSLLFYPRYVRKVLGIPPFEYFTTLWIRPGLAVLPFAVAGFFVERYAPARGLFIFFFQIGCLLPLALFSSWFVCFSPQERSLFPAKLKSMVASL